MARLTNQGPKHTMAEVLDLFGQEYCNNNHTSFEQRNVMIRILNCRTAAMGEHWYKCDHCDQLDRFYNSCGDRHCPSCQGTEREKWILARTGDLLPVKYFHVVFTIPAELRLLFMQNRELMYDLLFSASWKSLEEFGQDKRQKMEAKLGAVAVLHTWTQQLMYHPHVHMIVPAGGIGNDGQWKKSKGSENFLFWTKALAKKFRGKFLDHLYQHFLKGEIQCNGDLKYLRKKNQFYHFKDALYQKEWVVNCKEPFAKPEWVIEYLARYTFKVAISNYRILAIDKQKKTVTFSYLDRENGNKKESKTIPAQKFIKRFLMHILPHGFTKIRHYGFLATRVKTLKLEKIRELLSIIATEKILKNTALVIKNTLGAGAMRCKKCDKGVMSHLAFTPKIRGQPKVLVFA